MDGSVTKYIIENTQRNINFDVTSVVNKGLDIAAKLRDKELSCDLIKYHEGLNNDLVVRLIEHSEKITEKMVELFERREAEYMRAGKMQKVFGFAKWSSISTNAFNAAIYDTKQILSISNPIEIPEVKRILSIRAETQVMIASHLSNMFADEPIKKLNFQGVNKILGIE